MPGATIEFEGPDGNELPPRPASQVAPDKAKTDMRFGFAVGTWHVTVINSDAQRSNALTFQLRQPPSAGPAPTITDVSPSPVPGADGPQVFLVLGTGFRDGANVTLRDKTNGEVYPNRRIFSLQPTSIEIAPNFTNSTASWTVEVINADTKTTGEHPFDVRRQERQRPGPVIDSVAPAAPIASPQSQRLSITILRTEFRPPLR